jgi:hypothetical protein
MPKHKKRTVNKQSSKFTIIIVEVPNRIKEDKKNVTSKRRKFFVSLVVMLLSFFIYTFLKEMNVFDFITKNWDSLEPQSAIFQWIFQFVFFFVALFCFTD